VGTLDTTLDLGDGRRADVEMTAVSVSAARLSDGPWTWRLSAGLLLDGTLTTAGGREHDLKSGGLLAVSGERRGRRGSGWAPSWDYTLAVSATRAETETARSDERADYFAADLRLGARASWQPGAGVVVYTAGRIFGGPVSWQLDGEDVDGTDINHYQLAAGAAGRLGPVGVFLEWAALGEQGFSAGLSSTW
jgi:hypothetical protein